MNLLHQAPPWAQTLVIALLLLAAVQDVVQRRISNLLCAAVAVAAVGAAVAMGPSLALWQNLVLFTALLLLGAPLFAAGWLGGGDVKLLAAVGLWVDFRTILPLLACIFLAGGVMALGSLFMRRRARTRDDKGVPYGVAIASGVAVMLIGSVVLERATGPVRPLDLHSTRAARVTIDAGPGVDRSAANSFD